MYLIGQYGWYGCTPKLKFPPFDKRVDQICFDESKIFAKIECKILGIPTHSLLDELHIFHIFVVFSYYRSS